MIIRIDRIGPWCLSSFGLLAMTAGLALGNEVGEAVFERVCTACHTPAADGTTPDYAPAIGNKIGWSYRLELGGGSRDKFYQSALRGFGNMPPRGGVPTLSDEEVTAAVDYMLDTSLGQ